MTAVSDIFDVLGGPTAIARELRIKPSTASEMKRRGSIPAEYWAELAAIAEKHRHPEINAELLATLHARSAIVGRTKSEDLNSQPDRSASNNPPDARSSHFGRFKHLRRNTFGSAEEINDHIRALRDEWDRR